MAPRLRYVLSTGETLGERRPEAPPVAEVVDRLRAVALDTLHALGQTVTRPDDTWFGANRVVTGRAAGVS